MVDYTKFAKFYVAVSTLVALACTVGFVVMVATMPQCPHRTNFKCPTTEGHTSQPPSSIGPYGITPPLLDSTDIVLEDSVTSLTMSEVYEAKTKTKQGSITRREPHGKNVPFPDPDSINDDGEFPSPVTSDAGNPDVEPQPETSCTTSPEADGFIGQLIRSLLSMMNDPDLQNLEDQHLLNIMLINIVNATYSRPTHRMEAETEAIRQNTSNNVQKIRKSSGKSFLPSFRENFSDGGEEMESENKSTVNIAKMVNGLATSSHDGYVNKADTYNLDVEKHSSGTESVEVDDSLNEINQALEESHVFELDITKVMEEIAASDVLDELDNVNANFNINVESQLNGLGHSNSIDSSSDDDISDIDIQKTTKGIGFANTKTQAIDEAHVFELDITKVMEEIAASDVLDELDNVNANFNINIESQLNGLGHSNSIDSSSDDDISEIDIQKTTKGIGFANTKTQAIDEAQVFELDISKEMKAIASLDPTDHSENVNAAVKVNIEKQLNGLGHSDSMNSSSGNQISYVDMEKTVNGIGLSHDNKSDNDDAHIFKLDVDKDMRGIASSVVFLYPHNSTTELDVGKTAIGIAFSNNQNAGDVRNKKQELNLQKQVVGIASANREQPNNFDKEITGISSSYTNNENSNDANDLKLDIGKVMEGVAASNVFNDSHYHMERKNVGVASSSTRTSSNGKTVEPKLYIQKQAVGIAAANTKQSSSHPGKNQH